MASLTYCSRHTLSTGAAGVYGTEAVFRLGSLFDPDFATGGHQPLYYDQLAALYGKYMVHHCDVEITLSNPSADGAVLGIAVQRSNETYTLTGNAVDYAMEHPTVKTMFVNNTGSQVLTWRKRLPNHMVEGLTQRQYLSSVDEYGAAVTANPSFSPYVRFGLASSNGDSGVTANVLVRLNYRAQFFDQVFITSS